MRLPEPSPWQYLAGLALLGLAYGVAVGNGFDIDVEHDPERPWVFLIAATMASLGVILLWISLRATRR